MALSYGFCLAPSACDSKQFSEVFHALIGDGVCTYGDRFSATISGFAVTLSTGLALMNGRWLKNDEPILFELLPSSNIADRYDAIAAKVNYGTRKAVLELLIGVDPTAIRADHSLIRNDKEYSVILYLIHVKRGATNLYVEDVADTRGDSELCGYIAPLTAASVDILDIDKFLTSGIDEEIARLIGSSNAEIEKANQTIAALDASIQAKNVTKIGEILLSKLCPSPLGAWLLCDGGNVPVRYQELSTMLGGILPSIAPMDPRLLAYIYGGLPEMEPVAFVV